MKRFDLCDVYCISVFHHFQGLTAYKDLTEQLCFVSPMYPEVAGLYGVLFVYQNENQVRSNILPSL